jgi:hypothetical protein
VAAGYLHRGERPSIALAVSPTPVAPSPPRFSYFKILPDIERKIPDADIAREKREVRLGKPPMEGQFFIQPGSFREREQAENLKRQLETYGKLKPRLEKSSLSLPPGTASNWVLTARCQTPIRSGYSCANARLTASCRPRRTARRSDTTGLAARGHRQLEFRVVAARRFMDK